MATQAERSAGMQTKLLEATVACLIELGYARTSTTEICRRAGVSRGAQLHHFPAKAQLVAGAVEHLFRRRLEDFRAFLSELGAGRVSPDLASIFEYLWIVYRGDIYYAWLELVVASRTDPELRAQLAAVDRGFTEQADALCGVFLVGIVEATEIPAMTRLLLSIFDGLATHRILCDGDQEARDVLAWFLRMSRPVTGTRDRAAQAAVAAAPPSRGRRTPKG